MTDIICEKRQKILDESGHLLVIGGPGSGKTTIALKKAMRVIEAGLLPGQAVLFLSFSRAAVSRIAEASKNAVQKDKRQQLSIQTFHSFCWELLRSHGYLVGCPRKRLELLLPHEEKALSRGLKAPQKGQAVSDSWTSWQQERQRLFNEEGKITFDLFAPKSVELLQRCPLIRELVADKYPLIIVDEAQDTGHDAWRCIEALAVHAQVICLGDLEQQIFDHLEGVGPERIENIKTSLRPLLIDLGNDNNRSPGTEIARFANDILDNVVRGSSYDGVLRQMYSPTDNPEKRFRIALGRVYQSVKKAKGRWPESVAILAPTSKGVAHVSAALNAGDKPVRHKVLFDEVAALLSARLAAFLLEPKRIENASVDIATVLALLADVRCSDGSTTAIQESDKYRKWATDIARGKTVNTNIAKAASALIHSALNLMLSGDPREDWLKIKRLLRDSLQSEIQRCATNLDYLIAFNRGKLIAGNLSEMWMGHGAYVRAREALESALVEDQLIAGVDDLRGIHVMTIHKSKGKQFDAVIIFREGQKISQRDWRSTLVWRDDPAPYFRSRKILRVAITRAQSRVLLLEPHFPQCPILSPHTL